MLNGETFPTIAAIMIDYKTTLKEKRIVRIIDKIVDWNDCICRRIHFLTSKRVERESKIRIHSGCIYNGRRWSWRSSSNSMEIWFTTELGIRGSVIPGVAIPDGVVLKVVRNGDVMTEANQVELIKEKIPLEPSLEGTKLKASAFNYRIQQSQVI